MQVLVGDIGGTHSRLAIAAVDDAGRVTLGRTEQYPSRGQPAFAPIVQDFLAAGSERPERASFAIAGPVAGGEVDATNLPWRVRAADLGAAIGVRRTLLINDFLGIGYGLGQIAPGGLVTLQAGVPEPEGVAALIGAGTGLGQAWALLRGGRVSVHPSEGGHASFAPESALETGLLEFLRGEYGHVSTERVLSGPGLVNIYRYLRSRAHAPESPAVAHAMATGDPGAAVTHHAAAGDPLCAAALDLFVRIYGAQAGNLALALLPARGLYVAGGIAAHILAQLGDGPFLEAFRAKGRMDRLLARIPVHVVTDPAVGLLGAAVAAAFEA